MRTGNVRVPAKSDATYLERAAYISFLPSDTTQRQDHQQYVQKSTLLKSPGVWYLLPHGGLCRATLQTQSAVDRPVKIIKPPSGCSFFPTLSPLWVGEISGQKLHVSSDFAGTSSAAV